MENSQGLMLSEERYSTNHGIDMREKRLFERLTSKGRHPEIRTVYNSGVLTTSIIENLQRLLNTRRGCVLTEPDLGLFDLTEFISDFPDSVHFMEESIKMIIQKYEPRMTHVRVERIEEDEFKDNLLFQITGYLLAENEKYPVLFESRLNPDGNMQVKR